MAQENEARKRAWRTWRTWRKGSHKRALWSRMWDRTGLADKTVYDFLQLLIVPLALAAIGFWFTAQQETRQREIEDQRYP